MKWFTLTLIILLFYLPTRTEAFPFHFITIHCDPPTESTIEVDYEVLRGMVKYANEAGIKLTIDFTWLWALYIAESPSRISEVHRWHSQGHEIGAHHHSLTNSPAWDGYTDYDSRYAEIYLLWKPDVKRVPYRGTLSDLMRLLGRINLPFTTGCMNDELDKKALADQITIDTCGGYANHGPIDSLNVKGDPAAGINERINGGWWKGIYRQWLSHFMIKGFSALQSAKYTFRQVPDRSVYGVIFHAVDYQAKLFEQYVDYLVRLNVPVKKSLTVHQIVRWQILPVEEIAVDQHQEKPLHIPFEIDEHHG